MTIMDEIVVWGSLCVLVAGGLGLVLPAFVRFVLRNGADVCPAHLRPSDDSGPNVRGMP